MYTTLQDIKIETIDFQWIKQTTKISHLKRAIRIIELDGDFYKQLKDACYHRIQQIDPTQKRIVFDNKISLQAKALIDEELNDWQKKLEKKQKKTQPTQTNLDDYESYFQNENKGNEKKKKTDSAERERIKGNEAIKSKDYDEAITYYTKSIEHDSGMYQSYGNRALAYLKKKQYNRCIEDCENAMRINKNYTKAYHRKAKALVGLKKKVQAYRCLKQIIKLEPDNSEVNKQIKELREQMSQHEISELQSSLIPKSEFKKITIEQDSDQQIVQN